jgi:hypothetical protein
VYGTPGSPRQPDPEEPTSAGLMGGIQELEVSMQLEDGGLRSVVSWSWGAQE